MAHSSPWRLFVCICVRRGVARSKRVPYHHFPHPSSTMDGRTLEEQEKDINEVLRKAFRTPPKSAPVSGEAVSMTDALAH